MQTYKASPQEMKQMYAKSPVSDHYGGKSALEVLSDDMTDPDCVDFAAATRKVQIPNELLRGDRLGLSQEAAFALGVLLLRSKDGEIVFLVEQLSGTLGRSLHRTVETLRLLERRGMVKTVGRDGRLYRLSIKPAFDHMKTITYEGWIELNAQKE